MKTTLLRNFEKLSLTLLIALISISDNLFAQTIPSAQSAIYTQNFSGLTTTSTTYTIGWQGWKLGTASTSSFRTTAPTADESLIASGSASSTAGGVYNYNGKVGILPSGSIDPSIVVVVNTTNVSNVTVTFDAMTIRNPYDGSSNTRKNNVELQYRVGSSSGAFTSLGSIYRNNTTTQTGSGVTTPQNSQTISITLPTSCNNQSAVQLRWAQRDSSGSGSRPSFAFDNICITGKHHISAGSTTTFCSGGSVTLSTPLTGTYAWSNSATTASISATTTGNYFTTVTSSGCASKSDTTHVTVNSFNLNNTIFSESIGTVSSTTTIASHETANGFDNDTYTMSGTADVRNTSASSGYSGASGGANIFMTLTTPVTFQISGINTTGFVSPQLSFGIYKSTNASNGSGVTVDVSTDGINYTALTIPALPTGSGTSIWHYVTATGTIPVTSNLRIRFTQSDASTYFRLDDISLKANVTTPFITASGATSFCTGGNVVLTANVASAYLWNTGATTQSITVSANGSYSVTLTDPNGCSNYTTATNITVYSLPIANAGNDTTVVSGALATIGVSPHTGFLYSWTPDFGLSNSLSANPSFVLSNFDSLLASKTFTYKLTVSSGNCPSAFDSVKITVKADSLNNQIRKKTGIPCGITGGYLSSLNGASQSFRTMINVDQYPSTAIEDCGKFRIYYEDLLPGNPQAGYADVPLGATRRSTLCAVLTYVQSVFDFSNVPNHSIRLEVAKSFSTSNPAPSTIFFLAQAGPVHLATGPGIINGFVYDYMQTGIDPQTNSNGYHCTLTTNFDIVYDPTGVASPIQINWQDNPNATFVNCNYDLYSVLLHEVSHIMGWLSFTNYNMGVPAFTTGTNACSGLDYLMFQGPNTFPLTLSKLIGGSVTNPSINASTLINNEIWINNNGSPENHPVYSGGLQDPAVLVLTSILSHLDDQPYVYTYRERVSPGSFQEYVMSPFTYEGRQRRTYTKAEIQTLATLGYTIKAPFVTSNLVTNHVPFSKRMATPVLDFALNRGYPDTDLPNYTHTNDAGTSLIIDLTTLLTTDLIDADNDPISVMSGSLYNIRGCGSGGNNHVGLTLSSNNKIITYTPRPNFFGRAQFGFTLWDGKEAGSSVVFTIDVLKGTANSSTCLAGSNLILNGDYEEGTEVRRIGTEETIPNSSITDNEHEGVYNGGNILSDAHPYSQLGNFWYPGGGGTLVNNSATNCSGTQINYKAGNQASNFPQAGYFPTPIASGGIGQRYNLFRWTDNYYSLCSAAESCHRYVLEFDYYTVSASGSLPIDIRFINTPVEGTLPTSNYAFNHNLNVSNGNWTHVSIPFTYCGASPSNFIQIFQSSYLATLGSFIDNVSLIEDLTPALPLTVSVSPASLSFCQGGNVTLTPVITNSLCTNTYNWQPGNLTTASINVAPTSNTTYTLTVNDGCRSETASVAVAPVNCICTDGPNIASTNWTNSFSLTSNALYALNSNITVSGNNVIISDVEIEIADGKSITINSGASLTINHSHLFACSNMWQGIIVNPGGSLIINDANSNGTTIIEDAILAVNVSSPNTSTFLTVTNTIFNKNYDGINLSNFQSTTSANYTHFTITNSLFTCRQIRWILPMGWPSVSTLNALNPTWIGTLSEHHVIADRFSDVLKSPHSGEISRNGIILTDVGSFAGSTYYDLIINGDNGSGTVNVFDALLFGLNCNNTNLSCYNNSFQYIKESAPNTDGFAINANDPSLASNNAIRVTDNFSAGVNHFYDCTRAVNVDNYNQVYVSLADIRSTQDPAFNPSEGDLGIYVKTPICTNIILDNNTITNIRTGIAFYADGTGSPASQSIGPVQISNNTIQANFPGEPLSGTYPLLGIIANNNIFNYSGSSLTGPTVYNINISDNHLHDVHNGIGMLYWIYYFWTPVLGQGNRAFTQNNYVNLQEQTYPGTGNQQIGIYHVACLGSRINNNNVEGFDNTNDLWYGIYSLSGSIQDLEQISCNRTYNTGQGIYFNNNGTAFFNSNVMESCGKGLTLDNNTTLGDQGDSFEASDNQWTGTGTGAMAYLGTGQYTAWTDNGSDPNNNKLYIQSSATYDPSTTGNGCGSTNPLLVYNSGTLPSAGGPSTLVCGTLPSFRLTNASGTQTTTSFNSNPDIALLERMVSDSVYYSSYSANQFINAKHKVFRRIMMQPELKDSSEILSDFYYDAQNSNIDKLADAESNLALGQLSNASSLLGSVAPSNSIEINYKNYYYAYLNFKQNSVTSSDSVNLANLIIGCVMRDGDVVNQARSLYSLIYTDFTPHFDNCVDTTSSFYRSGKLQSVKINKGNSTRNLDVFPNPNTGNFTMILNNQSDVEAEIILSDITGKTIISYKQQLKDGKLFFDKKLSNGVYLLNVKSSDGYIYSPKRIVILN